MLEFTPKASSPSVPPTTDQDTPKSRLEIELEVQEIVKDILAKLDLPPTLRIQLRKRRGLH